MVADAESKASSRHVTRREGITWLLAALGALRMALSHPKIVNDLTALSPVLNATSQRSRHSQALVSDLQEQRTPVHPAGARGPPLRARAQTRAAPPKARVSMR
jgi:hypothetical protein